MAMFIYADDYDDQYPMAEKWCDLLIAHCEVGPRQLVCKGSDAKMGESSYAFNKNLIDKKPTEVPPDVVVLFETKGGWNQFGGPELVTFENHEGKGCNILFNDLHVEFVKPERLEELKWDVEEDE